MASGYGEDWDYLYSEESHIEGLELFCADGSALNVVRYIDNGYASDEWSWMVREATGRGYNVIASYDADIYFDDIDSAYADLMDFLSYSRPNLLPREHVAAPGRARLKFLEKAMACGFAVLVAFSTFANTAQMAFADTGGSSPVVLEVIPVENSDQALYTIHEGDNVARYYVGDQDVIRRNLANTAQQKVEIDGICDALDYTGVVYEIGGGVCQIRSPFTVWVETEGGLCFEIYSPELVQQVAAVSAETGKGWIPFSSFTVPEQFVEELNGSLATYGEDLVAVQLDKVEQDDDAGDVRPLAAVGAFVAWGAVYGFFVKRSSSSSSDQDEYWD